MTDPGSLTPSDRGLRERFIRLAQDKSYLQLTIQLMNDVSRTGGVEEVVGRALSGIVEKIGGTNAILYYFAEETIRYADMLGHREVVTSIDDEEVRTVLASRQIRCTASDFGNTLLLTRPFSRSWTWTVPLRVGEELIGAIQLCNMHLSIEELEGVIQPFFSYLAMTLKTSLAEEAKLHWAYEQLKETNRALVTENEGRRRAEKQLQRVNLELEKLVHDRTAELELARHDLQAILDNMPAMIGYWDRNLRNRFGNRAYREWFGIDPGKMPGMHIREVLGEARYALNLPFIEKALQGETQVFEREIPTPGGREVRCSQAYYIPDLRNGVVLGFYVLVTDITDVKRAERAAEAANQAKSEFLAMMSHEIRTPITGVLGMADLLRRTPLNAEQTSYLNTLSSATRTLLVILNDILDISKIEAGKLELETIAFNMHEIVRDIVVLNRSDVDAKNLAVAMDIAPEVPETVVGDPARVRQILQNLFSNAVKFTDSGGVHLRVSLAGQDGTRVVLMVEVRDTGIGIDPGRRDRLFQPFSQLDPSSSRRFGGTGLGLVISRRLVELMGGEIGVDSAAGKGSRFWFTLGLELPSGPLAAAAGRAAPAALPPRPLRILLAEDNRINQMLVSAMLRKSGHQVEMVENGRLALAAVQVAAFDVVLMDMQMPEMDGSEATRAIRALPPPLCRIPILALTADVLPEHRERFFKAGINDLVGKPIDWAVLATALEQHVPRIESEPVPVPDAPPPPPPPLSGLPGIDRVLAMRRTGGQLDLFWSLYADFAVDCAGEAERIEQAIREGEWTIARRRAHSLRGSAGNLGATRLAAAAGVIEKALRADVGVGLEAELMELRLSLDEVIEGARAQGPAITASGPASGAAGL
ncbi:MAG: ATP-binding protein [Rhodospirillaceae bacterium]